MTTAEKAKAYDEAIERFKTFKEKYYTKDTNLGDVIFDKIGKMQKDFESIFPELTESKDERVLQALIRGFENWKDNDIVSFYDTKVDDILAYLEKQKEQKPAEVDESTKRLNENWMNKYFDDQKSAEWKPQTESLEALMYAIEGKWEMIKPTSYLSRRLEDLYEGLVNTFNVDETLIAELPKITYSAKDIEELRALKDKIEASMERKPAAKQDYSGLTDFERAIHRGFLCAGVENVPVGIIKETAQDCIIHIDHKPAEWSGTNDLVFRDICNHLEEEEYDDWVVLLKALRDGEFKRPEPEWSEEDIKKIRSEEYTKGFNDAAFGGKLKEWNEEDEKMRNLLIETLDDKSHYFPFKETKKKMIDWLNSLLPQPSWKPSEEHMAALNAILCTGAFSYVGQATELQELYIELKKL